VQFGFYEWTREFWWILARHDDQQEVILTRLRMRITWRIPKELLPQFFCVTSRDWRKTSSQIVNSDHIEARMRYCILHRLYPASRFDWDNITVIKSGQEFSRNKTHVLLRRRPITLPPKFHIQNIAQ